MKLGLTTESFLSAIQGGRMNLIKIIEFAHQHGFEGIQIVNCKDTWRKDISDDIKMNLMRMRERKVRYFSYGVRYDLGDDDNTTRWRAMNKIREAILLASITNVSDVCIYGTGLNSTSREWEGIADFVLDGLKECLALAEQKHITLCLVNGGTACNGSEVLHTIINTCNSEYLKVSLDIAAFLLVNEEPADAVRELADSIRNVHFTDVKNTDSFVGDQWTTISGRQLMPCVLGEGIVPQREVLYTLKQVDFDGYVSVLYQGEEEPAVGIERSATYLKTMLREVRNP
jgi:sugar phosphate isomerase/epimerase